MLFETYKDMRANKINIPRDLYLKLLTLHSYVIVKKIVKLQIHEDAAKLLNRVCKNIIQFPAHAVNILTSSVIEAAKANFKYLAFQWACVLVRPDYRLVTLLFLIFHHFKITISKTIYFSYSV